MTMCPYKWALYIGSLLALLWVAVGLWMEWQDAGDADSVAARARVKAAALAADADADDGVDSDDDGAALVAVQ